MESKIKITSMDNILIVKIFGDLDSCKIFLYKEKIHLYMRQLGPKYIIWDFKNLTFIDSGGIGLILGRFNEIERIKGNMGFIGLNDYSRKIISISGLSSLIKEYRSIKDFIKEEGLKI
jgi:stage II sporulation protein AA (anti-sigma F factor antagonist)